MKLYKPRAFTWDFTVYHDFPDIENVHVFLNSLIFRHRVKPVKPKKWLKTDSESTNNTLRNS